MARKKRFAPEQIITMLREAEVKQAQGVSIGEICKPLALADQGLIDEYEFIVHPKVVGHGPNVLAGLSKAVDLRLASRHELDSGAVVLRYEPRR
jgi:hypothetical protein